MAGLWGGAVFIAVATFAAAATRYEPMFLLATSAVPAWRAVLFAVLTLFGAVVARRAGLKLAPSKSGLVAAIASAALVAALVLVLDGVLFRAALAPEYVASFNEPLALRLAFYPARSLTEEILYRLVVMSCLFWLAQRWNPRALTLTLCCAILIAQLLNVLPKSGDTTFVYLLARFIVPGLVWGFLFWRYNFATAALAHMTCHLLLQPALGHILIK